MVSCIQDGQDTVEGKRLKLSITSLQAQKVRLPLIPLVFELMSCFFVQQSSSYVPLTLMRVHGRDLVLSLQLQKSESRVPLVSLPSNLLLLPMLIHGY